MMAHARSAEEAWSPPLAARVAAPLREQVVSALRRAILESKLKPGQRLIERELIERLGVSRTTVREALRELTSEGLVTVVPQRGAVVAMPSVEDAKDLYEVRVALESLIVRRFIARCTPEQIAELREALAAFRKAAKAASRGGDIIELIDVKDRFYAVLIAGAQSPVLQPLLESIQARVQALRMASLSRPGRSLESVNELCAVVDAIEAHDADKAARLTAKHIRKAAKNIAI